MNKFNIIIVGVGEMGFAHLSSFVKNGKGNLFLVEKNLKRRKEIKKYLSNKYKNFCLKSSIPKKKYFHFAIIATSSNERYFVTKSLLSNNKVKFLFLEKFLFNKSNEYKVIDKIIKKKKVKTYVDVWSKNFLNKIKVNTKQNHDLKINVELSKNSILTNLIHFYDIFREFNGNNITFNFNNLKLKNNNSYADGHGEIVLNGSKNNEMIITAKKKMSTFIINFNNLKEYEVDEKIICKNTNKVIKFPLASRTTASFFNNLNKQNNRDSSLFFPNYKTASLHSQKILNELKNYYKRDIKIK